MHCFISDNQFEFSCSFIGGHHQKRTDKNSSDRCILNFIMLCYYFYLQFLLIHILIVCKIKDMLLNTVAKTHL